MIKHKTLFCSQVLTSGKLAGIYAKAHLVALCLCDIDTVLITRSCDHFIFGNILFTNIVIVDGAGQQPATQLENKN